jgi:hypothetical protein
MTARQMKPFTPGTLVELDRNAIGNAEKREREAEKLPSMSLSVSIGFEL